MRAALLRAHSKFSNVRASRRAAAKKSSKRVPLPRFSVAGRLAPGPCSQIAYNLDRHGLGSSPQQLPTDASAWVLLFTKASPTGRVVDAAAGESQDSADQLRRALRSYAPAAQPGLSTEDRDELERLRDTVEQIKALLSS